MGNPASPEEFGRKDAKHILATPAGHARFMAIKYQIQAATGEPVPQWDLIDLLVAMYEKLAPVKSTIDLAEGIPHTMPEVIDQLIQLWETT